MNASMLVSDLIGRGVRLTADADRLVVNAPYGVVTAADRSALARHKAGVLAILNGTPRPVAPSWDALVAQRWGPAVGDPEPGIDVPANSWRWAVACLPIADWLTWRRRSGEIQATLGHPPTAEEINESDRLAAAELGIDGAANHPRPTTPLESTQL